jgi:hypothetical protein
MKEVILAIVRLFAHAALCILCGESVTDLASKTTQSGGIAEESMLEH